MLHEAMSSDISKVIRSATKPQEGPLKDKHIQAVHKYLSRPDYDSNVLLANLSQQLLPQLKSPSLLVSLKAHFLLHRLMTDQVLNRYALFNLISRYFNSANRSSVDNSLFLPAPPTFATPSLKSHASSGAINPSKKSKLKNKTSFLLFRSSSANLANVLDDLESSKPTILPNIAHSVSQSTETNRLASAYNRYLRERILHFRRLGSDAITEKMEKTSIVDDNNNYAHQPDFSQNLLNQIQCIIQQIRLILACVFTKAILDRPMYHYCYTLVAKDLSILFRFLNIALVTALQNFFTLSTSNAERTLFAYKEYTQLQIADEVISFVKLASNDVSKADLEIPQALRQDQKAINALTKSLENYLYEVGEETPKESDVSDLVSERSSNTSRSSIMESEKIYTTPLHYTPKSPKSPTSPRLRHEYHNHNMQFSNTNTSMATTIASSSNDGVNKFEVPPKSILRMSSTSSLASRSAQSLSHYASNPITKEYTPDVEPLRIHKQKSMRSLPPESLSSPVESYPESIDAMVAMESPRMSMEPTFSHEPEARSIDSKSTLKPYTSNSPKPEIALQNQQQQQQPQPSLQHQPVSILKSKSISQSVDTRTLPSASVNMYPEMRAPKTPMTPTQPTLESFIQEDPGAESWKEALESLDNPEATFSLKFDIAAALQRSIKQYENEQKGYVSVPSRSTLTPSLTSDSQYSSINHLNSGSPHSPAFKNKLSQFSEIGNPYGEDSKNFGFSGSLDTASDYSNKSMKTKASGVLKKLKF